MSGISVSMEGMNDAVKDIQANGNVSDETRAKLADMYDDDTVNAMLAKANSVAAYTDPYASSDIYGDPYSAELASIYPGSQ